MITTENGEVFLENAEVDEMILTILEHLYGRLKHLLSLSKVDLDNIDAWLHEDPSVQILKSEIFRNLDIPTASLGCVIDILKARNEGEDERN